MSAKFAVNKAVGLAGLGNGIMNSRGMAMMMISKQAKNIMFKLTLRWVQAAILGTLICGAVTRISAQDAVAPQANAITSTTANPTPGDSKTYLGGLQESVDPATGMVSIRVPAPMPQDRGVSLPTYAWIYDTSVHLSMKPDYQISHTGGPSTNVLATTDLHIDGSTLETYLPNTVHNDTDTLTDYVNVGPGSFTATCTPATHFVYTDSSGGNHPLSLFYVDPANNGSSGCDHWGLSGALIYGGDEYYKAVLDPSNYQNVTITDLHGNRLTTQYIQSEDTNGNLGHGSGRDASLTADSVGNYQSLTVPGISGSYQYSYTHFSATGNRSINAHLIGSDSFCITQKNIPWSYSANLLNSLTLPDSRSYSFTYDPDFAVISKITYPSGATVSYSWDVVPNKEDISFTPFAISRSGLSPEPCPYTYDWIALTKRTVSYDGVNIAREEDYSYEMTYPDGGNATNSEWISKKTTVKTTDHLALDSAGHFTVSSVEYAYQRGSQMGEPNTLGTIASLVPAESSAKYLDGDGNTLRTTLKSWATPKLLAAECTSLSDGPLSGVFYTYSTMTFPGNQWVNGTTNALPTSVAEYDYGTLGTTCTQPPSTTPPTRETVTEYKTFGVSPNAPSFPAILGRPLSVKIYGNGTLQAETDYGYDETTVDKVSATSHDDDPNNYLNTSTAPRGNVTTITRKCFGCTDSVTTMIYDATGQLSSVKTQDRKTSYDYTDKYVSGSGSASGNTNIFPTTITKPKTGNINHVETYAYYFGQAKLEKRTDENSQSTTFSYSDPWNRLTSTTLPDGGGSGFTYHDTGLKPSVDSSTALSSGISLTSTAVYDGMWHKTQSKLTSDPAGAVYVDSAYDGRGNMTSSNNPYRGSTSSGATLVKYDSLGRNVQVTHQDGSTVSWDYSGNSVIITDELSRKTKQVSDALGRLTDVYEANLDASTTTVCSGGTCRQIFNPGYHTHYTYDALNNLTKVEQYGGAATPQVTRSFLYDSLSRLISSTNPETSGAITYSYTSSGGGFCASDPSLICSKTDARNITTTYSYDDLDRLVSKTYSDGTPYSCYAYDTSSLAYPSANMLGRLAHEWTQVGGCDLSSTSTIMTRRSVRKYDPLGRAKVEQRCVLSNCTTSTTSTPFSLHMEYDLAGNVTEYDNGFQSLNITNSFDSAGRLVKVTSGAYGPGHPNTLYKVNSFLPSGVPNTWDLGLNLSVTQNQDSRLRPKDLTVTEK